MCLVLGSRIVHDPPISKLTGWKVFFVDVDGLRSPYVADLVQLGRRAKAEARGGGKFSSPQERGFHFYFTQEDARDALEQLGGRNWSWLPRSLWRDYVIVRCEMEQVVEEGKDGSWGIRAANDPSFARASQRRVGIALFQTPLEVLHEEALPA